MKRTALLLGVLAIVTAGFVVQNIDLASTIDTRTTMHKPAHAAAADSGIRVDRAGYGCLAMVANSGQADNVAATIQLVIIDSIAGTAAWQLVDSVSVDSVDNKTYKLGYRRPNRWVRTLARATGNAADTTGINAMFVLGCKRAR